MADPAQKQPAVERQPSDQEPIDEKLIISLTASFLKRIEDYRFDNRYPSMSAAVRNLIDLGLQTEAWRAQKKPKA